MNMRREPGLDLLRAAAIVWVMLYHLESYGLPLPGLAHHGWMGVDLFFVLSGYLIGWQLLKPYTSGAQPVWGEFFMRRALRVLPAYLTVLALYFAIASISESEAIAPAWQFLTFTANLFPDYLHYRAYSHAWSLCVEEHFYLLLPAIVWLLARKPALAKTAAAFGVVFIGGMLLRGWLWQHGVAPYADQSTYMLRFVEVIYNPTWNRLDGLLAGVMLATARAFRPAFWARAMQFAPLLLILGVGGVAASMRIEPVSYPGATVLFPLLSFSLAFIALAAISPRTWLGRVSVPGVRPLATISFSLYLTHKLVYHTIQERFGDVLGHEGVLVFCIYNGAALVTAAVLYLVVERSGLRLRDRVGKRARGGAGAGLPPVIERR